MVFFQDEKIELYMHQRLFWRPSNIFLRWLTNQRSRSHGRWVGGNHNFLPTNVAKTTSHGPNNKVVSGLAFSSLRNGPTGGCWWWQRGQQNWLLDGLVHRHKPQHSTKENTKVLEDDSPLVYNWSYRSGMCLFGKKHPKKCLSKRGKSTPVAGSNCPQIKHPNGTPSNSVQTPTLIMEANPLF